MTKMLIVGGTGAVGREVVRIAISKGLQPRVLARDQERARTVLGPEVEIVSGDLDDPASLAAALRGVQVASLATAPGPSLTEQEGNFVEAARTAGIKRVVSLSAFNVPRSPIDAWHAASEQRLRSSGIPHVILRPVMFMSNFLWEAASIKSGRIASVFGGGRMSFVDPVDVAELTVNALIDAEPTVAANSVWTFGGPEGLSYDDVAATFTRVLGRPVEHLRLDEDTFRTNAPLPPFVVEAVIATAAHVRQGKLVVNDAVVREKLGRPARTFGEWVEAHRSAFAS